MLSTRLTRADRPLKKDAARRSILGRDGAGLIEVLLCATILAGTAFAISAALTIRRTQMISSNRILSLATIRNNLVVLLQNNYVWAKLISDPVCGKNMACLNGGDCTPIANQSQPLICVPDLSTSVPPIYIIDSRNLSQGFGLDANVCMTYAYVPGGKGPGISPQCPFQYSLTWTPICQPAVPGSCLSPTVLIQGTTQPPALPVGALTSTSMYDFQIRH